MCQQAVFYYNAEEGTILNVTDELWPALEYVFVQFDLKDDGVNTYRLEYNNYGLVNLIDFVNIGAAP
jgi:hypothetical protein